MDNSKGSILNAVLSVTGIIVLAKILGFVKQIITAKYFGATIETDIIMIAEGLVSNMDYLLVQALSTAFVPIYLYAIKENKIEGRRFVSNSIAVFFFVTVCISAVFFVGSPMISRILAPNYTQELSDALSLYIKIFSPVLVLLVELAIFNSLLKANEIFIPGEMIGFNQSVILMLLICTIGNKLGPDTLVVGFYAYAVVNLILLMIYSKKYWGLGKGIFADSNIKKMLRMMGPLLLGYSVVFVNQQVDKIIVSGFEAGTVTAMSYASSLSNFAVTFIASICGVLFTYITQQVVKENDKEAADLTFTSMIQMITLFLPISIITILNATDIVQIVFGRGRFDATAVINCSVAVTGYAVMFVPFVLRELFSRFQYGYHDSKTPMINSTIAIVINIVLSVTLSKIIGVLGVTLSTSISVAVCGGLNYITSKRKNKYLRFSERRKVISRWIVGIILLVAITYGGKILLKDISSVVRLVIVVMVSLGVYFMVNFSLLKPLLVRFIKRK